MMKPLFTNEERIILHKYEANKEYIRNEKAMVLEHEKLLGLEADTPWMTENRGAKLNNKIE